MRIARTIVALALLAAPGLGVTRPALAVDPGLPYPATSDASDQKAGAVLFYNLVTSNPTRFEDTRLTMTNTSETSAAFVRLFFVDGKTVAVSNSVVLLTSNQTKNLFASELAPGRRGYAVAVAVDGVFGCPISHNFLTGQAHIRLPKGQGTLAAVAVAALYNGTVPGCDANSVTANLNFNGVVNDGYNRVPRTVELENVPSPASGPTLVVLNRVGGNLTTAAATLGPLTGSLFDDAENRFGFSIPNSGPQIVQPLSNSFPQTTPPLGTVIPVGRTGWLKLNSPSDIGIMGAAMFPSPARGAVNLRAITYSGTNMYTIPVDPPF